MWISDILTAINLLSDIAEENGDNPPLIEKIEPNFDRYIAKNSHQF